MCFVYIILAYTYGFMMVYIIRAFYESNVNGLFLIANPVFNLIVLCVSPLIIYYCSAKGGAGLSDWEHRNDR